MLPFEAADLTFITGGASIARVIGLSFFLVYIWYYNPLFGDRPLPRSSLALWCFAAYVACVLVYGLLSGGAIGRIATLIQLIVMFWITADLLQERQIACAVLLAYSIAASILAVAVLFQLPGFTSEVVPGRVTALRENLNALGTHMAIAAVATIGLHLKKAYRGTTLLLAGAIPALLAGVVSTGSRGALAALLLGCGIYLVPYRHSKNVMTAVAVAVLIIASGVYMVGRSPEFRQRWEQSYYEGSLSSREEIFPATLEMISERPLLGWGPVALGYELGFRTGGWEANDTHNLILHLLAEVGVVGTIPFLLGMLCCFVAAVRGRKGPLGLLPLGSMIVIVVASLSGNQIVWKPLWLVMALTIAASARLLDRRSRVIPIRVSGKVEAKETSIS
jgi:O-antigen ligase